MATIYALGSNGSGQLGIGHKEDVSVPKEVLFEEPLPVDYINSPRIFAGGNHTLILCDEILYCSGDPSSGACGLLPVTKQDSSQFRRVLLNREDPSKGSEFGVRVKFCAATWEASIIISNDNAGRATEVSSFGTGNKGELGLGDLIFCSPKAQLIQDFPPPNTEIVDLAASVSHVVAVLSNGEAYGWGNGRKGQLGGPETVVYAPRKIEDIHFKVNRAICGHEFTYLLGEPEDGKHTILGRDKWKVRSSMPSIMSDWKDVGASWGSLFILLKNGKLLSWGREDHGQLGPPNLPELIQIAIGSEHALGLTAIGDVLAWGWGEHGNCGPSTTGGDVRGRWNVIGSSKHLPSDSKIISIAAGYATSWISIGS